MSEDANETTWENKGMTFPLFPFDAPQIVSLPNGTQHHFRLWDAVTEKRREDLLKTVVLVSPHLINGENPRDAKTDFTRSLLAYYDMMIESISGVGYNGHKATDVLLAKEETGETRRDGKPARIVDLIGVPVRKAAASRLYGGKIEVERPDVEDDESDDVDPFAEPDISEQIQKSEKHKELYRLTLQRNVVVRHELGIETVQGRSSEPTHVCRHHFREPDGDDFSKWELKGSRGYAVPLSKGGERAERYYNLDTVNTLYNSLIEQIEGASLNGRPIVLSQDRDDAQRVAILAKVPLAIKKSTIATLFSEMANLGNS